jgi:hypothetical protein
MITTLHETGSSENFDLTIKYNLAQNWDQSKTGNVTPSFYSSAGGIYSWPRTFGTNEIHCNLDDLVIPLETTNGDSMHKLKSIVYVDVFSSSANLGRLFCDEVNRIIWDVLKPNATNRIKKSNGTDNSAITEFENTTMLWKKEKFQNPQNKLYNHYSGELRIIWYQFRT